MPTTEYDCPIKNGEYDQILLTADAEDITFMCRNEGCNKTLHFSKLVDETYFESEQLGSCPLGANDIGDWTTGVG